MRVVLVCGGRHFDRERAVFDVLDELHSRATIDVLVEGGARGADRIAGDWAASRGVDLIVYPANWLGHGNGAGPMRNRRMLEHARPGLVVAFPGGPGTRDMVRLAHEAGVEVIEPLRAAPTTQPSRRTA